MIQENIKTTLKKDFWLCLKANLDKDLTKFVFIAAQIIFYSSLPVMAKMNSISAIYFNSDSSIVIETTQKQNLDFEISNDADQSRILIDQISLVNDLPSEIQRAGKRLNIRRLKSEKRAWYKSRDQVVIEVFSDKKIKTGVSTVLDGLAYQIDLETEENNPKSLAHQDSQNQAIHKLNASLSEKTFLSFIDSKSVAEQFLDDVDIDLSQDEEFISDAFQKIDSTSLTHIGSKLETTGNLADAFKAYNEALEIDPSNISAKLGLARTSLDRMEKLKYFIAAIDDQALSEIGSEWHRQGIETNSPYEISKSLVPFQLCVLKNPKQPEPRFAYAKVLEDSGPDYYSQASKRYLEAAVLAKRKIQAGEKSYNSLMRKATESLIRTLTLIGDQDSAVKYCNSYLGLGFSNFLDGRSIASIIKEIKFNRNPFLGS